MTAIEKLMLRSWLTELARGRRARRAGAAIAELDRHALAVGIDRDELLCAIGAVGGADGIVVIWRRLLLDLRREGGDGVLAMKQGHLNIGAIAAPFRSVFPSFENFAVHGDLLVDVDGHFVGFGADCDAGEEERYGCECGCDFRKFHGCEAP